MTNDNIFNQNLMKTNILIKKNMLNKNSVILKNLIYNLFTAGFIWQRIVPNVELYILL